MSWLLGGIYCGLIWLVFAKLKLLRLSLPIAVVLAAAGPLMIVALLFCAQYFHPYTANARVFQEVVPIVAQLRQPGRVTEVVVEPNQQVAAGDVLFKIDPIPYENTVNQLKAALEEARQGEQAAVASIALADASLKRAESNLDYATKDRDRTSQLVESKAISKEEFDASINRYDVADTGLNQAIASQTQARLSVDVAKAKIQQIQTQLEGAEYDLSQTTVYAPGDGFVTNLQLRPGMMVSGANASVMSFILDSSESNRGVVVASFDQKNFLRIKPGHYAEVALFGYPGEIMTGRVINTIDVSGDGQLQASGVLPSDLGGGPPTQFAVRIKLDRGGELRMPGGSRAQVAVYTSDVQIAGIPIMFLIRANSWMRYVM